MALFFYVGVDDYFVRKVCEIQRNRSGFACGFTKEQYVAVAERMHKTMDSPLSIGFIVAFDRFFLMLGIDLPLHYASLYLVQQ